MDEVRDAEGVPHLVEPEDVRVILRQESENRVIDNDGYPMYDCLARTLKSLLSRRWALPNDNNRGNQASADTNLPCHIEHYTSPENIQTSVADLLAAHSKQFKSVLVLLVDDIPAEAVPNNLPGSKDHEKQLESFYQKIISDCRSGGNYQKYIKLCIYAASTCINTPIYIQCTNEIGKCQWTYFQPLFQYTDQPKSVLSYVTMFMSADKDFHKIYSNDMSAPAPSATGLVGMYFSILEEINPTMILVPEELRRLQAKSKSKLCYTVSREIVLQCCALFMERQLIETEAYKKMTAHRASRLEFAKFVTNTEDAFIIVCQILLKRREKTVLMSYVNEWGLFVSTCDFLAKFDAVVALDNAIYERNIRVSTFINSCKAGGQELDDRRKKITTTVIASSSVGIVSGGMVIAGIILAPFSFGASLGLSIAGGTIGVGTGVAAGTARTVEAVKQNSKLKDIKAEQDKIRNKEERVAKALEKTEQCFQSTIKGMNASDEEGPGTSRRGFLAVGSAFRASHSIAGIALAAVRLGSTAASISASVLGPLSLVFDIAFLAEAAVDKAKGDKTNAGELLQSLGETVDMKCKIFNNMLRGNCEEQKRLFE